MRRTLDLATLAGCRGKVLVSSDGDEIGKVREVIYDFLTGEPVWIGVGEHMVTLLVPAAGVTAEDDYVQSTFTKEQIENQPPTDFGQGFANSSEERDLYEYFGMAMDGQPELRVLLRDDDLPGLEQTTSE